MEFENHHHRPKTAARARRITELVRGLEADGYLIGADRDGSGYWVKMPNAPTPDTCGLMKINDAFREDETLRPPLVRWLLEHRPYHEWSERIARQPQEQPIS